MYSTLHTNDAPSAITRLIDMGVENYLITSSVVAVMAQRLVRLICNHCKVEDGTRIAPDGEIVTCFKGAGCEHCFGSGYAGRVGIFELMELNDDIRKLIVRGEDAIAITLARAPQRHAQLARGRLVEGSARTDNARRGNACHAGILAVVAHALLRAAFTLV